MKLEKINFRNRQFNIRVLIMLALILMVFLVQLPVELLTVKKFNGLVSFLLAVIYLLGFSLAIWIAYKVFQKVNPYHYKKINRHDILLMFEWVLIFFGAEMIFGLLNNLLYRQQQTANNQIIQQVVGSSHLTLVLMVITSIFASPILEELIFRGYFMNAFFAPNDFWEPIIASGVLFSLLHMHDLNLINFITYGTLGAILAYAYKKSKNIKVSIGMHLLNNAFAMLMMIIQILNN